MISIGAGLTFGARVQSFPNGLSPGIVGVRLLDNAGGLVLPRTTSGIIEDPLGSGSYVTQLIAPNTDGQYSVMWDWGSSPSQAAFEDLFVIASGATALIDTAFLGVSPDEPHFDLPFRLSGKTFATVQQDSSEDIANCVECIVRTPLGAREDTDDFGLDDYTFNNQPLNLELMKSQISVQEPRASLMLSQEIEEIVSKVTIRVGG